MNEGILTRSRFHNKTLANQAIFLFSISTTFITPPNYYMWLHVIAFLVKIFVEVYDIDSPAGKVLYRALKSVTGLQTLAKLVS